MNILSYMKEHLLYLDGGMGTMLQKAGLKPGELPERWCITHPDEVTAIHRAYFDAGCNTVSANTFGANSLHFGEDLEEIIAAAMACAKRAREESCGTQEKFIAMDIGPSGRMLRPYGDLDFEEAVALFGECARFGEKHGADFILIETMSDSYEAKAALLAAKENSSLPIFVSAAFGEDGKLLTGASPAALAAMLEGLGADAIGANCSVGPEKLAPVIEEFLRASSLPILAKPNAGLPRMEGERTIYDLAPDGFAAQMERLLQKGVRIAGGCCGTTPDHLSAMIKATKELAPLPVIKKTETVVSSYTHAVSFSEENLPLLIGERINPTGKKRFKEALLANDMGYILSEGIRQEERGAHILDVNVGLPGIDEASMLSRAITELQAVTALPLQIDTANPIAMERALRLYNGKAMVNSVCGKEESMAAVFPLVKKYGGVVVALTLDENGIPDDAAGRVAIAEHILARAAEYGIDKKDIVFDTLAMTVSAQPQAPLVTIEALRRIRRDLGCHTSLGVSNVSFGLPAREEINRTFFTMALEGGLSAAIMNPHSAGMMASYHAWRALTARDENCADFVAFAPLLQPAAMTEQKTASQSGAENTLARAIVKGMKEDASRLAAEKLLTTEPMTLITEDVIPALNEVGRGFEAKTIFLPQLLMSAEAASTAFEEVKRRAKKENTEKGMTVVLATVKGDIHDIGKNIVKLLLENYGFSVIDLGRDVSPNEILDTVLSSKAPLAGLSALMTTTVPAMEETVKLIREKAPFCRVMVGGAVLTQDYANAMGADAYAKDAMGAVRYAESVKAGI